ncbi:MAG: hypothetical protein WC889_12415, partial [Myxococcota bacterium]
MKKTLILAGFFIMIAGIMLPGCSSSEVGPGDGGVKPDGSVVVDNKETCKSGVVALYGPLNKIRVEFNATAYPFPNSYYTIGDKSSPTGLRLNYTEGGMPPDLNEQNGFGTYTFLMEKILVTGEKAAGVHASINMASMPQTAATTDPSSAIFVVPREEFLKTDKAGFSKIAIPLEFQVNQNTGTFFGSNRVILKENTEYLFVVTKSLKADIVDNVTGSVTEEGVCIAAAE